MTLILEYFLNSTSLLRLAASSIGLRVFLPNAHRLSNSISSIAGLTVNISCIVNGQKQSADVNPNLLLVDFLREKLGLTGTKNPLDYGQTGACTILLNGKAVKSSMMLAVQADNSELVTVEGLSDSEHLSALQESFKTFHAVQCGYCTPAALLVLTELLNRIDSPTEEQIRMQLDSVLCRCTGFQNIVLAALDVAKGNPTTQQ